MIVDDERCFLALSILDGEEGAHRILADLLEEEGDAGLAQWARSGKGSLRKKFDIAMGVLPPNVNIELACDYALHAFGQIKTRGWRPPNQNKIKVIQKWARGGKLTDKVTDAIAILANDGSGRHSAIASTALADAARNGLDFEKVSERRLQRHHRTEVAQHSRNVAKHCREELSSHGYSNQPARAELNWQAEHLVEMLQKDD